MKESFRFFSSFLETARAIQDTELRAKYLMSVVEYGLEWKQANDEIVRALMVQTQFVIDRSEWISLSASERWKMWWAPKWNSNAVKNFEKVSKQANKLNQANSSKNKQKQTKTSEEEYIDNTNVLSSNTKVLDTNRITENINWLITELKELANSLWIAYDKKDERNFWKHILTAKEFNEFASKLNQSPVDFAKNIMVASVKINYRKWPCNWPKAIYQNYAEVYNQTVAKSRKVAITNDEWVF